MPQVNERIEAAVDDLDATIKDIRRSIFALGSAEAAADIQTEITRLVERAASTLKFRPTLEIDGPVRSTVSDDVAPHLLAVLGETLSNAIRHAGATKIDVRVSAGDSLDLVVRDNGGGIPEEAQESGLRNIRDRATALGGACARSRRPRTGPPSRGRCRSAERLVDPQDSQNVGRTKSVGCGESASQPATDDGDADGQHHQAGSGVGCQVDVRVAGQADQDAAHSAVNSVMILTSATTASGPAMLRPRSRRTPTAATHGSTTTRSSTNTG